MGESITSRPRSEASAIMPHTAKNLFEGLPVQLIPSAKEAHAKLKTLVGEHSEHVSGETLGAFLETLNRLKKAADSEGMTETR